MNNWNERLPWSANTQQAPVEGPCFCRKGTLLGADQFLDLFGLKTGGLSSNAWVDTIF
jgi:hypothetical protein